VSTRAYITHAIDGTLVLVDPDGSEMVEALGKISCMRLLDANAERLAHFAERARGRANVCFVLLDVDDPRGAALADVLMPGHDWQQYRRRGEVPIARGLATFDGMVGVLESLQEGLASAWMRCGDDDLPVVVMTAGAVLVTQHRRSAP
jgi:hypothetical protein